MPVPHVLVILGYRLNQGDTASLLLLERLSYGVRFFRLHERGAKSPFKLVVLSGGMTRPEQRRSEADVMRAELPRGVIPEGMLVCETESQNTLENIRNAIRAAEERFPGQQIAFMFVTQSWHYPQAVLHFRACMDGNGGVRHFLAQPPLPVPGELPLGPSFVRFLVLLYTAADPRHRLLGWARQMRARLRPQPGQSVETTTA